MKYINIKRKPKYNSVTLYMYDNPSEADLATFFDFRQATQYIKDHGLFVAYLEDIPEERHQRWGMRRWNS